jgi:hypothetical protein
MRSRYHGKMISEMEKLQLHGMGTILELIDRDSEETTSGPWGFLGANQSKMLQGVVHAQL